MIVVLDSQRPAKLLSIQRYDFSSDQLEAKEGPDLAEYHDKQCADTVKARGDIAVTLCESSSSMSIFSISDLSLIAGVNFEFYAQNSWIMLGEQGFDIVQNGNGYIIFFSSVET